MNHVTAISSHPGFRANGKAYDAPPLVPELPEDEAVEVGNGVTRYDFSIAFTRVCMRKGYPAIAIAAAMRLVESLPRGGGECAPGRDTMVAELGRSNRRIDEAYEILETGGWIKRRRGEGRNDPVIITLMIPPDDADAHQFGTKIFDRSRAARVARNSKPTTRRKKADHAQENSRPRATQCCASKEQEQEEQRPKAAAVDSQSPVTDETTATISAPYGADVTHGKEPAAMLTPEQINSIAEQILNEGGFGKADFAKLIGHLDKADKFTIIIKYQEIEQQRKAEIAA